MAKKDDSGGYPVGNTDPDKRGRSLPREDRESSGGKSPGGQRGKVGRGNVTDNGLEHEK